MTDLGISLLAWGLSAFFLFGAALNVRPPESIRSNYARWGYPNWFHYVTAGLEFAVAILLIPSGTRFLGAALGATIMFAALLSVLYYREYPLSVAPALVLIATAALAWITPWPS